VRHLPAPLAVALVAHTVSTLMMTGVIWFVQIVHYPLLADVGRQAFAYYEQRNTRATSYVVGPVMLTEAVSALTLLVLAPGSRALAAAGLLLLVAIWLSTFLIQVPCHRTLERGFDVAVHRRLARWNWIRTAGWSLRAAVAIALL
jgi:uncharacterized membrane protein YkgB